MTKTWVESSLIVDQNAILKYAEITDDFNPIHVDPAFAAKTPFGGVIAHGTMSLSLIWQSVSKTFGLEAITKAKLNIRFSKPVRVGDIVTAKGHYDQDSGHYLISVETDKGLTVIKGWLKV